MQDPHLISVDELRAAGALDVPPAWRKSLGVEPKGARGLFDDLGDDDVLPEKRQASLDDSEDDNDPETGD